MIEQLILKLTSNCNLSCKYCYYIHNENTLKGKMTLEKIKSLIINYFNYLTVHHSTFKTPGLIFHGGEPLLMGKKYFAEVYDFIARTYPEFNVNTSVCTNGLMLDEEWIDLFNSHHTSIAVSLDGLKPFHDAQRVYANGKGSFDDVIAAIRLLNATNTRFRALMVVNPDQDPREFYQFLSKEAIREIDLLLPMYNHSYRMPEDFDLRCADFMTGVFDHWFAENDSSRKIRIFESMLAAMLHRKPASCTLMNCACRTIITVQSDMNVGLCEDLSYTPVFNLSPLRADETDFIEIEQKVNQIISGGGLNVLPGQCETCDYQNVCNGGCPGLRFKAEGGFTNPSVYCRTYQKLIKRMYDTIGEKTLARYREMKG